MQKNKTPKKPNTFIFDKEKQECKRNGRKFGKILNWTDNEIEVLIETKQHRGTGEIMTFRIVAE
jgi:hypothetical protein